jgi:amidohydrolase
MTRTLLAASLLSILAPNARAADPWIDGKIDGLVTLYRDLHAHPELSYQEVETSRRIAKELTDLGAQVTPNVGKHGVVGLLKNGEGPVVLVRSDMDALPVAEATGLPYASKATGKNDAGELVPVMHACGHDIHMTCLVGTARWLADHKDRWSGTVILIGQPAEEAIGGAKAMLDDGLYTRFPRPDYALALHVAHDLETGKIGYISGPAMAGSTSLDIVVRGKGGHGAMPDKTVDPIVLASLLVLDMQTIVAREISPIQPAVITVGSIHGGTRHNIIPDEVRLQLTVRAFKDDVLNLLLSGIRRRAEALAKGHKAPAPSVEVAYSTTPTVNTPDLVSKVVPSLKKAIGESNLVVVDPTMGAEDFGLYGRDGVPTFMFRLGTIPAAQVADSRANDTPLPSLHSAHFAPDPAPSIRTGIAAMTSAVVGLLPPKE